MRVGGGSARRWWTRTSRRLFCRERRASSAAERASWLIASSTAESGAGAGGAGGTAGMTHGCLHCWDAAPPLPPGRCPRGADRARLLLRTPAPLPRPHRRFLKEQRIQIERSSCGCVDGRKKPRGRAGRVASCAGVPVPRTRVRGPGVSAWTRVP